MRDARGNCWARAAAAGCGCGRVIGAVGKCNPPRRRRCGAEPIRRPALPVTWRACVAQARRGCSRPARCSSRSPRRSGLLALLVIVTLLARRLERGRAGRVRAGGVARRLSARAAQQRGERGRPRDGGAARGRGARERVRRSRGALYALVGAATGLLIAGVAVAHRRRGARRASCASDARVGGIGLGAVTAVGIAASIQLDRLRAERMFAAAAGAEIAAVAIYLVLMVALILADASLAVIIALSGAAPAPERCDLRRDRAPARAGDPAAAEAATARHTAAIVPTAGWLLVIELSNLAMYASGRIILGVYRTPRAVGLYEGPVRAHNLLYALAGALAVPTVPDSLALRRHRRRPPPARAGRARQPLHARAVRAAVRDADGHVEADAGRVARGHATRTAPPRCHDPRLVLARSTAR